jgi:DNA ligase-1
MIKRPQKAPSESITNVQLEEVLQHGPLLGSPKLDGYRCTTQDAAFTSSMKKVTNLYAQELLSASAYNGLDGELIVGKPNLLETFNNTTGPIRRAAGYPDFTFYVFDKHDMPGANYKSRLADLYHYEGVPHVHIVKQEVLTTVKGVVAFELKCVKGGFEGAMIRSPHGIYKEGRCTLREQNIFKRKPTEDSECTIIGFEEQMLNMNKSKMNEMGNMVRSSHKANKVGKGTLGKFLVESPKWKKPFAIGTGKGLTDVLRQGIWDNQQYFLGKIFTYKYQQYGSIDAPRQPIYKGFRDSKDLTDY